MEATSVLVLSTDALAAALVGALVESEGYHAAFARRAEPPREALRRVRPRLVLADCDCPEACGPELIGPARMIGAGVVLFGRPQLGAYVRDCADLYGVGALVLPPAPGALRRALEEAREQA